LIDIYEVEPLERRREVSNKIFQHIQLILSRIFDSRNLLSQFSQIGVLLNAHFTLVEFGMVLFEIPQDLELNIPCDGEIAGFVLRNVLELGREVSGLLAPCQDGAYLVTVAIKQDQDI
jgi:hypothetical protein